MTVNSPPPRPLWKSPIRLFRPILAGASLRERLVACVGAFVCLGLTSIICGLLFSGDMNLPLLVAPIGASAVLLFAVPASPLAQPWPIIGGNTLSALVGVAVAKLVEDPVLAPALALMLAIGAMSLLRCLHPPGGAAALSAVMGGPAFAAAGFSLALVPFGLNAVILVALGWAFHKFTRRAYPHRPAPPVNTRGTLDPPPQLRVGFRPEDVEGALEDLGETFDIDRGDLDRLLRQVELRSLVRAHGGVSCAGIMSRDVIRIAPEASPAEAQAMILDHGVRSLPVVDGSSRLVGIVGLRELAHDGTEVADLMSEAVTAAPESDVLKLIPALTDGRTHAVVIVDVERRLLGVVTQTDLLVALSRILRPAGPSASPQS